MIKALGIVSILLSLLLAVSTAPSAAQVRMRNSEAQLLRQAAALESRGDFEGAGEVLLTLLENDPGSSGGLFALERVLRSSGDIVSILPAVDSFLENDPESSGVRSLKLRVLLEADSLDAVRREAERWLAADRRSEVPYREVSRVYERAFGAGEALELLRTGREAIGQVDVLSLEIGDLLAARGDVEGAAAEWALAVGDDASQVSTVTRRLQGLTEGVDVAGTIVATRLGDSAELARRRAGARISLDLGLADLALGLSRDVASDLEGRARTTFLADVARRARDQDLVEVASWAYDELGEESATPAERRQFDQRIIDVSLAAGDTAAALDAQRRVAASFSPGSVDRRRASAQVIRLEGTRSDADVLRTLLGQFREDFPNAPELDDLAATVASALLSRGDPASAAAVLDGVNGPKSSLERAYILLESGEIAEGRAALLIALTGLPPAEATPVIQFAGLLGRSTPEGTELLASAGVMAHRGRGGEAALGLAAAIADLEPDDHAPLLAEAARMAESAGDGALAAQIRERLVADYPDTLELGEAALALARYRATTSNGVDEAIRLLEALITERPNAAVVPDARVELQRLRGGW